MPHQSLYLEIAGFCLHFYCEEKETVIYIPEPYEPFVVENGTPDISIRVSYGLPEGLEKAPLVFKASNPDSQEPVNNNCLWGIHTHKGLNYVVTAEPYRHIHPYLTAYCPQESNEWTLFASEKIKKDGHFLLNPLAYPMGPLLLYHLALYNNAIMIHASGVEADANGFLFSGFSGVGKSTMAGLWSQTGHKVINDDRLLLRVEQGQCFMYNTPMTYKDVPKKTKLTKAFLLKQHQSNYLTEITGTDKLMRFMAFCIQHHYNKEHIKQIMSTVRAIINCISVYELGFVPDTTVVDLLKNEFEKY